jgi:hypothetical protein
MYGDRCGAPCEDDLQCGDGMFCAGGRCSAECGPGRGCSGGLQCTPRGRCTVDGFDDGDAGTGADACADLLLTLGKKTPTVLLLVDRSGSMAVGFPNPGSPSRWDVLKNVLLDGDVIQSLQSEVRFGLAMYSNPTRSMVGCPDVPGVPFALDNYDAIAGLLGDAGLEPDTPTGESILKVSGITDAGVDGGLAGLDAGGGEKVILLITDGDPDYCANPFANDEPTTEAERQKAKDISLDAVQRAFAVGIKTYVLAIGDEVSVPHQQEMANAGVGLSPDAGDAAPFFRPTDEAELTAQINGVILGARPCKFSLNGSVQPGQESQGTVVLNGAPLVYNASNGWRLTSPSELELLGSACEEVKTTPDAELRASFPCGAVDVR